MAAAEARAGWQRTANCYFAQEDARRAPKLPYGPYPSSSQSDTVHRNEANEPSCPTTGYTPGTRNRDGLPGTKWWLHLQPNFANESDLLYEQLNSFEAELEIMRVGYADQSAKISRNYEPIQVNSHQIDINTVVDLFSDQPRKISAACFRNEQDPKMPELKAEIGNIPIKTAKNMDMKEIWYTDDNLMGLFSPNSSASKQSKKLSSEWESHWEVEMEKNEPWWRTSDKDELAYLVAQKSLEHIENCDLPRPHAKHLRQGPSASPEYSCHDVIFNSFYHNSEMGGSSLTNCMHGTPISVNVIDKHYRLGDMEHSPRGSDKPLSENENYTTKKADIKNASESSPSKAQLLEALCHSQTRAREAEKAAQEAYTEKEHIIKLVFKQASQLFAYKQWFHLLQLENLCLQLKNKNGPICNLFPASIPSNSDKSHPPKKDRPTSGEKKCNLPIYEITKCAVAFAVGLSLAGAGLLLGWTMGWLFPAF